MKQLKIVLSTTLFLLLCINSHSQIQFLTVNSDLVVEGEVVSNLSKWNEERTLIYTENIILVKSVFKGNLSDSIIVVITPGGSIEEDFHFQTHSIALNPLEKGYFFLKSNENKSYQFTDRTYGFCPENLELNPKVFCHGQKYLKRKFEEEIIKVTLSSNLSIKDMLIYKGFEYLNDRDTCDILFPSRNPKTIEFSFDSIRYTDNYTHIEFVVMAKVNTPGLKFGKGDFFIQYSEEFGSNIALNQSVEVSKGVILENNLYNLSYSDTTSQSLSIKATSNFGINNAAYTFSASSESIFRIKLLIADFTQIGNISFDDFDISGRIYYWCQESYEPFDEVILDDPITSTESQPGSEIGITYTFENATENFDATEFSVELFAEATSASLYDVGFIYINYNELGFGESVVSNGTFTFEVGDFIDTPVYTPFIVDVDNNTIQILIFSQDEANPNDFSQLSTTPQKLGILTFTIDDCDENKGLSCDEVAMQSAGTVHFTGNMPIPWEVYDPIIASDEENGKICGCIKPEIESFTPAIIHAGTGEILTIKGKNFGTFAPTLSTVIFKNGDDNGMDEMEAGIKDFEWDQIIHWSDEEIKVKVPSTDKDGPLENPASTGRFKVKNKCGEISDPSLEKLQIPYAIFNNRNGIFSTAQKVTLRETNETGICFNFSDITPDWVKTQFGLALASWCSETGIDFQIGSSIGNNNLALDNINLLTFENTSTGVIGGGMVIEAVYFQSTCTSGNEAGRIFSEIDFKVRSGITNPSLEDEANLREIIKHEFGHALMLAHSNSDVPASQYLMYTSGNIGGLITAADSEGANLIFANSSNIVHASCGTPIGSGHCAEKCFPSSTTSHHSDGLNIQVFPSPSSSEVSIKIEGTTNTDFNLSIFDIYGKRIQSWSGFPSTAPTIKLPHPPGVYMLQFEIDGRIFIKRALKL